jgi:hypothetical protein
MALFLFYAEDIKQQLVLAVGPEVRKRGKANLKGGKLLEAICQRLVGENLLSESESAELQDLIEHRNQIAHHIHLLTGDVELPGRRYGFQQYLNLRYDYAALTRLKKWQEVLWRRLEKKYWIVVSPSPLLFEAAEHAYQRELLSLKRRIDRQIEIRRKKVADKRPNKTLQATAAAPGS